MISSLQPSRLSKLILKRLSTIFVLIVLLSLAACQRTTPDISEPIELVGEHSVTEIPLFGPIAAARAEISGMAWCGDHLILLPQFPEMFIDEGSGSVFSIPEAALQAYLAGETTVTIEPDLISFESGNISTEISGFEGFEAIAFHGDDFFVTVEARQGSGMMGYLVKGAVATDCSGLTLEPDTRIAISPQADLSNMSDETIIVYEDLVHTIYEANGRNVNPDPVVHVFDPALNLVGKLTLPNIEYRITDATVVDEDDVFWAINYFYPGDTKLKPADDQIALTFGLGFSHADADQVERLIAFEFGENGVELAGLPPVYLELTGETARNWEGLVKFMGGFLLVTDEYPTTILGFVE